MGNLCGGPTGGGKRRAVDEDEPTAAVTLSDITVFEENEVQALYERFKAVSKSDAADGVINRVEFKRSIGLTRDDLFADRLFAVFDKRKNAVIDFKEFVVGLSNFHPRAPQEAKIDFSFKIFDLFDDGFIRREELERLLKAVCENNPYINLTEAQIKDVVARTFEEADTTGNNRITYEEYKAYCLKYPRMLRPMTLPLLGQLTSVYPSFVNNSFVLDDREKLQLHGGLTEEMAVEDERRRSVSTSRRPSRAGSRRQSLTAGEGKERAGSAGHGSGRRGSKQAGSGINADILREKIEEVAEEGDEKHDLLKS